MFEKYKYYYRTARLARKWANDELKKIACLFEGKIINVSAWKDEDRFGNFYKEYFKKASSYYISNVGGYRGTSGLPNELIIDLSKELSDEYLNNFDVVFNYNTLEHIYDFQVAFDNLVKLTNDIVILITPYAQDQHPSEDYGDFWRFTPYGVRKCLENRQMTVLYENITGIPNCAVYNFTIASKKPDRWNGIIENKQIDGKSQIVKDGWFLKILKNFKIGSC